jgi:hypothetical protein
MLVVRPVNVAVSTWGTDLLARERGYLAWIAPRGIVAAGVASLVAAALEEAGLSGGRELRALVFLTIAATVLIQGATADPIARLLRVRRPDRDAVAILGADGLALALAEVLLQAGRRITLLDANPDHCQAAERRGFPVVFGNALDERTLARARLEQAAIAIGGTANDEANSLFVRETQELFGVPERYVALTRSGSALSESLLPRQATRVLFDGPKDLGRWAVRLRHGSAVRLAFHFAGAPATATEPPEAALDPFVILAIQRRNEWLPMHTALEPAAGDRALVVVHEPELDAALDALARRGWQREAAGPGEAAPRSASA